MAAVADTFTSFRNAGAAMKEVEVSKESEREIRDLKERCDMEDQITCECRCHKFCHPQQEKIKSM